jgi:hypothetical protein
MNITGEPDAGTVRTILRNFGSFVPMVTGGISPPTAGDELSQIEQLVQAAVDGTWSLDLYANSQISPSNTFYQISIYPADATTPTCSGAYVLPIGDLDFSELIPIYPPDQPPPFVGPSGISGTRIFMAAVDIGAGCAIWIDQDGLAEPVDPTQGNGIGDTGPRPIVSGVSLSAVAAGHFFSAVVVWGSVQVITGSPGWIAGQKLYVTSAAGVVAPVISPYAAPFLGMAWFVYVGIAQSPNSFLYTPQVGNAVPLGWDW